MSSKIKEVKENTYVFSCGRMATGVIKLTEKIDLQLCCPCHLLLDPEDLMAWIPF